VHGQTIRSMELVRTNADLEAWRARSRGHVFVPTMGALHEGHLSLIRQGVALSRRRALEGGCVVSIFVNPTQFNESDDFASYPRDLDRDVAMCAGAGAACVYAPGVDQVYPPGREVRTPALPPVAREPGLEDALRPGHFAGVCRVLVRLFELVGPAIAIFGEKDWQQLQVARALVRQESIGVEIVGGRVVRDSDGLALSSRHVRLAAAQRETALALPASLAAGAAAASPRDAEVAMRRVLDAAGVPVEYAVVRDAASLAVPVGPGPYRALVAGRIGRVHLLDNAPWPAGPGERESGR
jgi:pantoate--beta-alanine ligase